MRLKPSALAVVFGLVVLTGCNESTKSSAGDDYDDGTAPVTDFNELALVTNIADNIVTPLFTEFAEISKVQHQQISAYCDTVKAEGSVDDALSQAKLSWRGNAVVWQQIEMMQLEPLLANEGKLRNDIYSWPEVYACGVDFDTMYFKADDFNGAPYDITARRANRKGLYALEYLLFNESSEHSCGVETPPNWHDFTPAEITIARCEFATEVAQDLTNNADKLVADWSGENGFIHQLKNAGTEQSSVESMHAAVNLLSDAMFYLDKFSKDGKLAAPLGLVANSCGAQACPEDVESDYAHHSIENLIENLNGFDKFFTGEAGLGFVDYLNFVGDTDTAEAMASAITTAIVQLEAYEASLAETLVADEAMVTQSHENVKAITDKLKVDFINSLSLELPTTSAGDND